MVASTRTRSGRIVKEPVRYEPDEKVLDDFAEDEYDEGVDLDASSDEGEDLGSSDDESSDEEEDADENGNLKEFVAYSDEETDSEYDEDEDEDSDESETDTDESEYETEDSDSDEDGVEETPASAELDKSVNEEQNADGHESD